MATQDIDTLITNAEQAAQDALAEASIFIDALKENLTETFSVKVPGSNNWSITSGSAFEEAINATPTRPTGLAFSGVGSLGPAPTPVIRDPDFPVVPGITSEAPIINIPTAPIVAIPSAPSEPSIGDVAIPVTPVLDLPDTPVLADVELPATPSIVLPVFDQLFPVEPDLLFDGHFDYSEPDFVTDLLTQLDGTIIDDLVNGATGLFNEEDGLFSRQRDRFAREGMIREQKARISASSRGFQLPNGILETLMDEARDQTQQQISEANRELLVLRADLVRKTREFMITQGLSLTQLLMTYFGFRHKRILEASKFSADFAKKVFDISVERWKVQIDAFQAFTTSYAEQVRAVLGQTEIFRSQLEASRIRGEINEQEIRIFLAQHEAAKTLVQLFNAQMGAAQIEATINQIRIQGFAERTRAFVSQVDAERTKLALYEAQISGEAAKVDLYGKQVQADLAQVQGVAVQASVEQLRVTADIESAKIDFETFAKQIEEFKARLDQEVSRVNTLTTVYGSDINAYAANIGGWNAFYLLGEKSVESFLRQIAEETRIAQEQSRQEFQQLATQAQFRAESAKDGVLLYRDLVSAARASIQSIASKEEVV